MVYQLLEKHLQRQPADAAGSSAMYTSFLEELSEMFSRYENKIKFLETNVTTLLQRIEVLDQQLLAETVDLKTTHQELSRIFNQVNEGFYTKNLVENKYLHISVGCEKIYGYQLDDFLNNNMLWYEVIHPEDRSLVEGEEELLRRGEQTISTYRIIHKDQSTRWIEVKALPVLAEGKLIMVQGLVNDITERKQAEITIRESEARYRSFFENSLDGILLGDKYGRIMEANPAACQIFQASEAVLCNSDSSGTPGFFEKQLEQLINPGSRSETSREELSLLRLDKSEFWAELASSWFTDAQGNERYCIMIRDISERKKSEKIIRDGEERISMIMSASLDAIICIDSVESITFWNPQAEKIFGWKADEVLGNKLSDLIIPYRFRQFHTSGLQQYLATGHGPALNILLELSAINRARVEFPIELTVLPIRQAGDAFFCAFIRDISPRKNAEKKVMESELRYRTLFKQNLAGVYQTNARGVIISCNDAFALMLGFQSATELQFTNATDLYFSSLDREEFISRLRKHNKLQNYEVTLKSRDGQAVHVIENISLILDSATGEEILLGIIIDITERKHAEAKLYDSEQRYRQIVETAQEGIWVLDKNADTVFANRKMYELLECNPADPAEHAGAAFISRGNTAAGSEIVATIKAGRAEHADRQLITCTGKHIWANISASPVHLPDGSFAGALVMITDITKRKKNEELLQKSEAVLDKKNKELERKNKELEQFAYVASHDLQEPLRTTSSFVQLLHQQYHGKLDARADKYFNFIVDASERMKVLIKDLLDYSRIGARRELAVLDTNCIMKDVIADLHSAISDSGAQISTTELPVINAYPTEIKLLFQNLTINAIKFRKAGIAPVVKVSARRVEEFWEFSFADNGIGIDKEHYERIFIIFQRLHNRSEYVGSGIGLSHCRKIVELHHGKIWVNSVPGEGSTFSFSIPA